MSGMEDMNKQLRDFIDLSPDRAERIVKVSDRLMQCWGDAYDDYYTGAGEEMVALELAFVINHFYNAILCGLFLGHKAEEFGKILACISLDDKIFKCLDAKVLGEPLKETLKEVENGVRED